MLFWLLLVLLLLLGNLIVDCFDGGTLKRFAVAETLQIAVTCWQTMTLFRMRVNGPPRRWFDDAAASLVHNITPLSEAQRPKEPGHSEFIITNYQPLP